jgi:hypothetical protein
MRDESFEDLVGQSFMSVNGNSPAVTVSPTNGYLMRSDQYLHGEDYSSDVSSGFTISFWLYSVNPGMVTNPISGDAEPIFMSLLDFIRGGSSNNSIIKITESSTSDEENCLVVTINDGAYTASTVSTYEASKWHHMWISYSGTSMYVYIDGVLSSLTETGSLPSSLDGSLFDLYVNYSIDGYTYNIGSNSGYIRDLLLFNDCDITNYSIQRAINLGYLYIADADYDFSVDMSNIYFDDPTTITVTSAVDDMSYIYVGRNDGKILCGSPLLWEVRKVYSNPDEASVIDFPTDASSPNNISNGFLKIKNTIIRL